ncbi:MAG: ammonia channel protein [SAR202 cluster bacterium Io17-Chloro-G3]|nr:MAG: ammonia channel protein [SAR202 cluster bacterium Io17-Chloro-G3]
MNSGDTAWVLASSALVFIMVPGLAFFYAGLVRAKNAISTIMQCFIAIALGTVVWVLWGYTLAFGPDAGWGLIGGLDYIGLRGVSAVAAGPYSDTIPHQTFMIFQAMFAIITPALIVGAFAERVKFTSLMVFIVLWSTIVYAPLAHWVWGADGWLGLSGWGALDFAGGSVVHISSGVAALAAVLVFGKRLKFGSEPMEPHNIPFVVLGAALLWFGWFGFNAGSALASGGSATSAFVVTNIAASVACLTWVALDYWRKGKASAVGAATGAVAGLATITPASGFVGPIPAVLIGLAAGSVCYMAIQLKNRVKLDDSLDVLAIHGVGGTIGMLAAGVFVGVGFLGISAHVLPGIDRGEQIIRQLGAIGAAGGWSFGLTMVILLALKHTIGIRVQPDEEEIGLDATQHGETV